jgi:SPASM domain peptide maturase of grasp-with-spasm system
MFADCIPVKGVQRGAIYDLNRRLYKLVPNSMVDFINESAGLTLNQIKEKYGVDSHHIVDEYISFLDSNHLMIWMHDSLLNSFKELDINWEFPAEITNAIIDLDDNSKFEICTILLQLENLGCKHLQIRSYSKRAIDYFENVLAFIISSKYLSIEIITRFDSEIPESRVKDLVKNHRRIKAFIFHSADHNKIINESEIESMANISYSKQLINSPADCHNNNKDYLNVSVKLFMEAQNFHSYFNKKVAIDINGNIKNCSSQERNFGNVSTDLISDIIKHKEFQFLWNVKKDQTKICKNCEFRYMCVDSRVPKQISGNEWEHDSECNYNPYLAQWSK